MDKLPIAIVGTGGISHLHAAAILNHADKAEAVALCDISEANLQARAAQLANNPRLFRDWKTMLKEYGDHFEAVIICLPHHLHGQAILDCVAAGKHILCEKPLCINLEEADRIVDAALEAGIIFMPGHNQLFEPIVAKIKELLTANTIGRIRWMRSQACFFNPCDFSQAWRGRRDVQGGGELIDTGYHGTYSLLYFADSPVASVKCSMGRYHHQIEGEDSASVQVLFENGAIGEVLTSWAYAKPHGTHDLHIIGETGQLYGSRGTLYFLPRGFSEPARMDLQPVTSFDRQLEYFVACVREGHRPLHSVEESREVLRVILAASENSAGWERHAALQIA